MPSSANFFWDYLPFWIMTYGLAAVGWTCLGRFLLSFFVLPDSPNYIWRWFRRLTDWAVSAASVITPQVVPPILLAPIAAVWVFLLRLLLGFLMLQASMVPLLSQQGGG